MTDPDHHVPPKAVQIANSIHDLGEQLLKLDLIGPDNPGTVRWPSTNEPVWGIEADHPDGGPWPYGREGVDTIVATRMRPDGQREHAVLNEYGVPTEWRVAIRPQNNQGRLARVVVQEL